MSLKEKEELKSHQETNSTGFYNCLATIVLLCLFREGEISSNRGNDLLLKFLKFR